MLREQMVSRSHTAADGLDFGSVWIPVPGFSLNDTTSFNDGPLLSPSQSLFMEVLWI